MLQLRNLSLLVSLLAGLLLTACASPSPLVCQPGERLQSQDLLYFGTHKNDGFVTQEQWSSFLKTTITPRFSEGLTVITAAGQWQDSDGNIVHEPSHILSLVYPQNPQKEAAITEIISRYKLRFNQKTVLRVRSSACVSFR
ncbi:DUF3574 domain-containing protein [Microbulbifer sp. CAU 1566]|uniref:DUF3574 domain-containing protein n=1 Tax=Microbulbifer sp. CAU 1566 TaxID=2933269 RepID=UPI002003CAED|nr:DUF3574 domain-containing protein [Microbulbifer sp. CAU 1566]MCK7596502.1 DUF3574 domain-containing protein [Microbulbifer sp. CAU 1566]